MTKLAVYRFERNFRDDSDFYTMVYDNTNNTAEIVETGSTRYCSEGLESGITYTWSDENIEQFEKTVLPSLIEQELTEYEYHSSLVRTVADLRENMVVTVKAVIKPRKLIASKPGTVLPEKYVCESGTEVVIKRIDSLYNRVLVENANNIRFWVNEKNIGSLYKVVHRSPSDLAPLARYRKLIRDRGYTMVIPTK